MTIPTRRLHTVTPPADKTFAPVYHPTVWQQNAHDFAHQADTYAAQERNASIREATQLRVAGEHGRAHYVLVRSFMRQVRILGLSYAGIPGKPYEIGGTLS